MSTVRRPPTYGFIGLGHQGSPMAERMVAAGLRPWLWARRAEVTDRYLATDARLAATPAELGAACDVIGLCLYDADATDEVLFGDDGLLREVRPGTVLAIHATVAPTYVTELADRVADLGVAVVDAPVSGGDEAAAAGQLLVIVGGDDDACAACEPMFDAYAGRVARVGPLGAAQASKLVNNALFAAITGLVFDAFELGRHFGIDPDGLAEVLANGSAANPSVGVYQHLGAEDFSIRAWPTLHKDVALVAEVAAAVGKPSSALLDTARATISRMERLRSHYVARREAESGGEA